MKRILPLVFLITAFSLLTFAKQVEERMAGKVAGNFFAGRLGKNQLKTLPIPQLVCTSNDLKTDKAAATKGAPAFYVFNFTGTPGFVIIAGDDIVTPVLGYSLEGSFAPTNIAPGATYWLNRYEEQIKDAVAQKLKTTPEIESAWSEYQEAGSGSNHPGKWGNEVKPLIVQKWGQSDPYNDKCPKAKGDTAPTGCTATAMAMLMKYHECPKVGTGSHSYNSVWYDRRLSANFGATEYKWDSMPSILDSSSRTKQKEAVATLMYHCGVSMDMIYSPGVSGGYLTERDNASVEKALKTYFGYDPGLKGIGRISYTDSGWIYLLKEDLDARRPVLYGAYGRNAGGHTFICDGYDNNGLFHFNWGWDGSFNNYFNINKLNPDGDDYSCSEKILKGVHPMAGQGNYLNLNLSAPVTLISDVIHYEDSISIMTNIRNNGKVDFEGSIGAAIFDSNQMRIGFVEIINPVEIPQGKNFDYILFRNSGLPNMLPGKYMIGIMYKSGGSDWMQVNDTLTYVNFPVIEVINPDVMEMASGMTIIPGTTLAEGTPVTVKLAIKNNGPQDFSGALNLAIHDMDGMYLYSIAVKSDITLASGASSGELTFATNRIPVDAGGYLLALWYKPSADIEYDLIGSTNFQNPVTLQVNASPLTPDLYEPNNTEETASFLPVSFSGNTADVKLKNANCHVGTDKDHYKIELPEDFSYVVFARLQVSEYDTNNSHPLNGYWEGSVKTKIDTTSLYPCSNQDPQRFEVKNGGTITFRVETNFIAQTGMYQLAINISKNPLGIEESDPSSTLRVYPNPSSGIVYLANGDAKGQTSEIIIRNMMGSPIYHQRSAAIGSDPYRMDLSEFPAGIYIATVRDNNQHLNHVKISIIK